MDDKQQELIRDNLELKELCLYLDEERANLAASIPAACSNCGTSIRTNVPTTTTSNALRDDGDGSSSSTNDEPMPSVRQFNNQQMVIFSQKHIFIEEPQLTNSMLVHYRMRRHVMF